MRLKATLLVMLIMLTSRWYAQAGEINVPGHYRTPQSILFVYKAEAAFRGAVVEVFFSNGDLVTSQRLVRRRLVIDFSHVKSGAYVIRVTKGDATRDFQFIKM